MGIWKDLQVFFYAGEYGKRCDHNAEKISQAVSKGADQNSMVDKASYATQKWLEDWWD